MAERFAFPLVFLLAIFLLDHLLTLWTADPEPEPACLCGCGIGGCGCSEGFNGCGCKWTQPFAGTMHRHHLVPVKHISNHLVDKDRCGEC